MATTYTDPIQTSDLPDALRVIYSEELDFVSRPNLIYDQFTESKNDFVAKKGQQVYWTIYRNLPPAIDKLTENVDVDGGKLSDFQVNFTVDEYGYAIGTTEKLDLISYHGPISNICRQVLGPQMSLTLDILARNTFIGSGVKYRSFGGTATARSELGATDKITETIVRRAAHNLAVRRVPPKGGAYLCITHPAVTYDLRNTTYWKDADLYSGSVKIYNGEVGMLHGVRFIETDNARLPNAGAQVAQTTLNDATCSAGDTTIVVTSASGFNAGDEITIFPAASSLPDGTDADEEHCVIHSINSNTLTLKAGLLADHANGAKVRSAVDVFPLVFLGAYTPVGKGVVLAPEVRVALPTDKLRRMHFVGWYGLLGYGIIRDWTLDVWEVSSDTNSAPAFMW